MSIQNKECKFCLPWKEFAIVAENNDAVAIICDTAKSWGHSLIIPKSHSSNLVSSGMDENIWKNGIVPLLREVIEKFKKNPQVIGFHINSNAGSSAEQSVFHTHIHVVPKYKKDKNEWIPFLNSGYSSSGDSKLFSSGWDAMYQDIMNHINDCSQKGILKKSGEGVIESFNLSAAIGNEPPNRQEHFWVIPKTNNSSYRWNGGGPHLDFATRKKIAERIKNEQWEEEKPNGPEENDNKGKRKDFKESKGPEKDNNSQEQNQNNDNQEAGNDQKSPPRNKESGNENGNRENEENRKRSEKPNDWRETLKEVDNSLEQTFDDKKISEWQAQEKGPFNTVDSVKKLLEGIKGDNDFLTEIKSKQLVTGLSGLIANKSPQQVIIIIKKFEYNKLSVRDKEIKDKKIKAYYKQLHKLAKNGKLTEEQINEYLYKQAIGEINESSIKVDTNEQKNIKPPKSNLAKLSIGIIIMAGGFFLILFIRKRKKRLDR